MEAWENLTAYWKNLQVQEIFAIIYSIVMIVFTLAINKLFLSFVGSKPDGRKTVIGNTYNINW